MLCDIIMSTSAPIQVVNSVVLGQPPRRILDVFKRVYRQRGEGLHCRPWHGTWPRRKSVAVAVPQPLIRQFPIDPDHLVHILRS